MECPVCRKLRGKPYSKHLGGHSHLCRDCYENQKVRQLWESYCILDQLIASAYRFKFLYPTGLVMVDICLFFRFGLTFSEVVGNLFCWGLWVFSIFWLWPRQKVGVTHMIDRQKKTVEELLVAKISGNHGQ